jgi:UDP-N-acetylglucosamine--N-acetylmuramyl-(pentapeptide) pyrophosphoryl-undecaprenol N-acetylglucosamine transferase
MLTILFTGGGSSGHVTPNLAVIKQLRTLPNIKIIYVGSSQGIEKKLIKQLNIPYYTVTTGKLRRYFSIKNFFTPIQVMIGIVQSILLCRKVKPNVVFSKGGFVAFPVVLGAWCNRIPVIAHESDITPGLANRLSFPFIHTICLTFLESLDFFSNKVKCIVTGMPIRADLLHGDRKRGLQWCRFNEDKPVLLVFGGGLGSAMLNRSIHRLLPRILPYFQVVHVCGNNKIETQDQSYTDYRQFEYIHDELADVFAMSDLVISRAGATAIFELLALNKPHILLPLSQRVSRGDQLDNATYFAQQGSMVLYPDDFSDERLLAFILQAFKQLEKSKSKIIHLNYARSTQLIVEQILKLCPHDKDSLAM